MPEYSGSGFLILATGSFFGEIGSDGEGEVFINSHNKSKGLVLDGAEKISSSADGATVDKEIRNSTTGEVIGTQRVTVASGELKQNFFSGSSAADSNTIQFLQTNAGGDSVAILHISGADSSKMGVNLDGTTFDRLIRPNRDMFVNSVHVFSVGLSSGSAGIGYEISNAVGMGGSNRRIFVEDNAHHSSDRIHLSGSVVVKGSTTIDGTLSATRKSFNIQHPSKPDKRLVYGSLEGPEFGVYIRGKVEGDNKIEMPDYWVDLVDMNTLSVHLTPINSEKAIYFTFSDNKYIYINREAHFFYMICAERKDIDRLQVEQ